jgi:hypothetical protein
MSPSPRPSSRCQYTAPPLSTDDPIAAQGCIARSNEPFALQRTPLNKSYILDLTSLGPIAASHSRAKEHLCLMHGAPLA